MREYIDTRPKEEKPKFKVGDLVRVINSGAFGEVYELNGHNNSIDVYIKHSGKVIEFMENEIERLEEI